MTSKIKAVIVDDEAGSVRTMEELLAKYCHSVEVVGKAFDPEEAAEVIAIQKPNLVFLDIEMPFGNAFDLLDKIAPVEFEIIFVTAFNNYAIKAFRYAAADYLLKPIDIEELKESVARIEQRMGEQRVNARIATLLENLQTPETGAFRKISLPTSDGFRIEDIHNIMYLNAEGSYTFIFMKGGEKILVSKNLKEFEDILPESIFCRIHHSSIVNINYVKQYYKGRGGEVVMEDGEVIMISTRKKADFFKMIR